MLALDAVSGVDRRALHRGHGAPRTVDPIVSSFLRSDRGLNPGIRIRPDAGEPTCLRMLYRVDREVVTVSDSKVKKKDRPHASPGSSPPGEQFPSGIPKRIYETELVRLQEELVKMTEWVKTSVSAWS